MTLDLRAAVDRLATVPGVVLSVAAVEREGLVLHASGGDGETAQAIAALMPAIYRRARAAGEAGGLGAPKLVRLEADGGDLLASARDGTVLIALAAPHANLGRLRLELLACIGELVQ